MTWDASTEIVLGAFLAALIVTLISYMRVANKLRHAHLPRQGSLLVQYMGAVKWDFSDSWTTTLTAVGALLGTVLSAIPTDVSTQERINVGLSLFFGLLIVIAPMVYRVSAKYVTLHNKPDEHELQGNVGTFFLTSGLTLWAVFGQLFTLIAILNDLATKTSPSYFVPLVHNVLFLFLVLTLVGTAVYAFRTLQWLVEDQMKVANRGKKRMLALEKEKKEKAQVTASEEEDFTADIESGRMRSSLKSWAML